MLSVQIDNKEIEQTLKEQFKSPEKIKQYLYELIVEDLEDKRFASIIQENHKKDYASKSEVFDILNKL
jgi:uncharacterized protein YwgA